MNMFRATIFVAIFVTTALAQPATRPVHQPKPSPGVPVKTVVYDIRSLLQPVKNYPPGSGPEFGNIFNGGGGGGGGAADGNPDGSRHAELVDAYIRLIEDSVDSESWHDNGGDIGQIREIGGLLIVTQVESAHQQIDMLLKQLLEKQARLVRVRIHWLIGTGEQLQLGNVQDRSALRQIDPAMLDKLPREVVHHVAETICFSGQTVFVQSGNQHAYISDLNPVVATDAVGFDPVLSVAEDGAYMQVTPTIQSDGQSAVVDLHSTVSGWSRANSIDLAATITGPTTRPASGRWVGETILDRPEVQKQSLNTTLRVPLGKSMVVGGMTMQPGAKDPSGPQLLIVIEVFGD